MVKCEHRSSVTEFKEASPLNALMIGPSISQL